MRGGGERLSANGGYLPAQAVYRLPLETSNDIMPSVAVVASRRVEKEKEECLLFFPFPFYRFDRRPRFRRHSKGGASAE